MKQVEYISVINWTITFFISIWVFFLIESIKYDQIIDFGLLEIIIILLFFFRHMYVKWNQKEFYLDTILLTHALFFGLFIIEIFNQKINGLWPTKFWPDSIIIVSCYSILILNKYNDSLKEKYVYMTNIFVIFAIITNSILNIIDPYIGEEEIDILRITIALLFMRVIYVNLTINRKIVILMMTGIIFGLIAYFGMVNGWMRFVGEKYEMPQSVMIIYVSLIIIIFPWLIFIGELNEKENINSD